MAEPELKLERKNFADVDLAKYNPRKRLTKRSRTYREIKQSLEKFGLCENLVWNERSNTVVGGHKRIQVGRAEFGWTSAEFHVVDLPPDEERELNVILNAVGEGGWDDNKLQKLLTELRDSPAVDIYSIGFDPGRVQEILGRKPKKTKRDPDAAPATPVKPVTKVGDIFEIITGDGETVHQLLCGDSTDYDDITRLMDSATARLVFTEPPHGVAYQIYQRNGRVRHKAVKSEELRDKVLQQTLVKAFGNIGSHCIDNPAAYVFHSSAAVMPFRLALIDSGWEERQQLIWQRQLTIGSEHYHVSHQPIFYCQRQGTPPNWYGNKTAQTLLEKTADEIGKLKLREAVELLQAIHASSTLLEVAKDPPSRVLHPTQKPTAVVRRALTNSSVMGDVVVDLFAGSGSTMIAAELESRHSRNVEIEPGLCDVIVQRFVETFEEVTLLRNGKEVNPESMK